MTAEIKLVTADGAILKKNCITIFEIEGIYRLFKIKTITPEVVVVKCILNRTLHSIPSEQINVTVKLLAVTNKVTLPVMYRDFDKFISKVLVKLTLEKIDLYIKGYVSITTTGIETKSYAKGNPEDSVEVTDLNVIDKYGLINKQNRIGTIKLVNHKSDIKSKSYVIKVNNSEITIKRNQFKLINRTDFKKLFSSNFSNSEINEIKS